MPCSRILVSIGNFALPRCPASGPSELGRTIRTYVLQCEPQHHRRGRGSAAPSSTSGRRIRDARGHRDRWPGACRRPPNGAHPPSSPPRNVAPPPAPSRHRHRRCPGVHLSPHDVEPHSSAHDAQDDDLEVTRLRGAARRCGGSGEPEAAAPSTTRNGRPRRGGHFKSNRRRPTLPGPKGQVPSALGGLTALFGMGRGVSPSQ